MKWPISDGSTAIFYMEDTVLSKYTAELEQFRVSVDLTDREHAIHKKLSTVRRSVVLESNKQQPATQSRK